MQELPTGPTRNPNTSSPVSFHNFKSQNFKLNVSNPKSKCVAYVSVLSRISNCQGLGRKNKFEVLKTARPREHSWSRKSSDAAQITQSYLICLHQ